jgi:two-component system, NarL family, response regulator
MMPHGQSPIRIMCVEDHRIVREGIVLLLERQPDFKVVATASNGRESIAQFRRHRPDVTLMDLELPLMGGVEAIRHIRREDADARIVVLTVYQGDEDIHRALQAGAATYLLKDTISDELVRVIREVHAGQHPLTPDVQARLAHRAEQRSLTPREVLVLELVSRGLRNRDIARSLNISEETVQVHVRNIVTKLDADSRMAAIRIAMQRGIIHIS